MPPRLVDSSHIVIIEIEDEKTWPSEVRRHLDKNIEILKKSQACEMEYLRSDINPFIIRFHNVVDVVNSKISGYEIIGYHCTRLLDYEVEEIKINGLSLPSKTLLQVRLKEAYKRGIISQKALDDIMRDNEYLNMPMRENLLYFVCGVSALKNEGVSKFLQFWGGEAVFNSHEISEHSHNLSKIGIPILVRAKIKPGHDKNIGKRLALAYLIARSIPTEDNPAFDYCSRVPMLPDNILEYISINDIEFLKLTGYLSWDDKKQPNH